MWSKLGECLFHPVVFHALTCHWAADAMRDLWAWQHIVFSRGKTDTQPGSSASWLCHTAACGTRSRSRVFPVFVPLWFFSRTSLTCQANKRWSPACVLLLFIQLFIWKPPFHLLTVCPSWFLLAFPHVSIVTLQYLPASVSWLLLSVSPSSLPGWQCRKLTNHTACDVLAFEWIWCS